jgi:D-3-phosphoglycerate dehydrogenase / 2-oxoglutarate reductase
MFTVTLLEPIHKSGLDLLRPHARLNQLSGPDDVGLVDALRESDAIIVRSTKIGAEILDYAPRLKVIGRHGAGIDNIDLQLTKSRGIEVRNTPYSNTESVAEYTIAALLHLFKRFDEVQRALRGGAFNAKGGSLPGQSDRMGLSGREISGTHLGIGGAGAIGQAVARRALALNMRVSAVDPYADPVALKRIGIELVSDLGDLLTTVDAISLHVPGGLSDKPLIGSRQLSSMRKDAILINAARGGLVDEDALAHALTEGVIAGAAVDVFSEEPPRLSAKLFHAPNLLATPHVAGVTQDSLERMATDVALFTLDALGISSMR